MNSPNDNPKESPSHEIATFQRALEILREQLYVKSGDDSIEPVVCRLHQTFGTANSIHHNCLGCNFADSSNGIDNALSRILVQPTTLDHDFSYFLLTVYLFVERANIVLDIIQVPESTRHKRFEIFVTIKRWANFFKHPNWFLLVHHPVYWIEGDAGYDSNRYPAVVDTQFVKDHFNAEAKSRSGAVRAKLQNKTGVAVLLPNPAQLTEEFCAAVNRLLELIGDNEVYREILSDITTYENYFSDPLK